MGVMEKTSEHASAEGDLSVPIGTSEFGSTIILDIRKLPHLIMSGMTGTGKSTFIHSILNSLLLKNSPDMLRLILIDFKRVELPLYNSVAHLLAPVIIDTKRAVMTIRWLNEEADRRNSILLSAGDTNIETYQKRISDSPTKGKGPHENMPYILCVMDEFSDGMMSYPKEMEAAIARLTHLSRNIGIHLILSTSRPNTSVITATLKENIPARAIFQVASSVDSRHLLGVAGAEARQRPGGMLFLKSEMTYPTDIQASNISEAEIKENIQKVIKKYGTTASVSTSISYDEDLDDQTYKEALEIVIESDKVSTSFLQRKMGLGYSRAAQIIDRLEEDGIIGPAIGAKPREVIKKPKNRGISHN
jgi:DNA segregation ATPase FtsK/SpoIIIE, S-DNA-T family